MLKSVNFLSIGSSVHKYYRILSVTITLITFCKIGFAQVPFKLEIEKQANHEKNKFNGSNRSITDDKNIDVTYYNCFWNVNPAVRFIEGSVAIYFKYGEQYNGTVKFDCNSTLTVDSILYNSAPILFSHLDNQIKLTIEGNTLGAVDSVVIFYHGVPESSGFGSFEIDTTSLGNPCMWTLSQPYGAKDWWPCKQSLTDKADSIDIVVSAPIGNYIASNGLLISEDSANGNIIAHWRHRYSIATYLIAIAVSNYERYSQIVPLSSGDLLVQNYVYPEDRGLWEWLSFNTNQTIQYFDSLLVPYPFMREKYGHAQFKWGGGMEHQTMSFMADIGSWLMSHELAHQWFGDYITCGSWRDIWLNESFATYFTGLYFERFTADFQIWKSNQMQYVMYLPGGKVLVDDTTQVDAIFNGRLTYSKGSVVLHMLRKTLGDEVFFTGLKSYLSDISLAQCFAYTSDFVKHMELVSNRDLSVFFNQWLEKEGYPILNIEWYQINGKLKLSIVQNHSISDVSPFTFIYPLTIYGKGIEQVNWVEINSTTNSFELEIPFSIDSLKADINFDFLVKTQVTQVSYDEANSLLIYPNPGNSNFTLKSTIKLLSDDAILFDLLGQVVPCKFSVSPDGFVGKLTIETLSSGIFFLKVKKEDGSFVSTHFIAN